MERETGLEPATSSLGSWHSTTELLPLAFDPKTDTKPSLGTWASSPFAWRAFGVLLRFSPYYSTAARGWGSPILPLYAHFIADRQVSFIHVRPSNNLTRCSLDLAWISCGEGQPRRRTVQVSVSFQAAQVDKPKCSQWFSRSIQALGSRQSASGPLTCGCRIPVTDPTGDGTHHALSYT
jgi:hypothetical protein